MRARAWGASALVYTALAAVLGREVLARIGTAIANDAGDPLLTAAILHWNAYHVPGSDAWWQFPIFHPTSDTLAFSEHLLGLSVVASPIAWATGNPLATYNITALLTFPLSALAMYALVVALTRHAGAAFLAGLAYGFAPYRISHLPHIQMLASFWAPLALLGLHRFLDTGRARWLALYGAAWVLQAMANWYALVFLSALVALWVLWFVIARRRWRALAAIGAATAIAAVPLVPLLYTYVTVHAYHGFERSIGEVRTYSADIAAVLCAPQSLSVWGWMRVACRAEGELFPGVAAAALAAAALYWALSRRTDPRGGADGPPLRGPEHPPSRSGGPRPGSPTGTRSGGPSGPRRAPWGPRSLLVVRRMLLAVALLFALIVVSVLVAGPWQIDVWFTRVSASSVDKPFLVALVAAVLALLLSLGAHAFRRPADAASFYLFAAIVTWAFALGPTLTFMGELSGRPGPFALLQELPGVDGLRVPARFWSMTVLCLATAIGLFVAGALRGRTPRLTRVAVALGGLALLADGWAAPIPAVPSPPRVPDAAALRGGVVLQLPIHPVPDVAATWRAVTGGWRSVNGYSGYVPTHYEALRIAATNADDAMFPPFQRDHELHVVVADEERAAKAAVERQPGAVVVAQSNGMTQYRLPRVATPFPDTSGERLPIAGAASDCAPDRVALALDGDEGTTWECLEDAEAHTLTLDLGVNATVDAVAYSQGRYFWVVPVRLEIDTSVDGAAWTPARHGRVLGELIAGTLRHAPSFGGVLRFAPREARYVRIRPVPDSPDFAWFVSEIEVRAPAP